MVNISIINFALILQGSLGGTIIVIFLLSPPLGIIEPFSLLDYA